MIDFTGKVVLVTGAASGIGRSCALTFARYGAAVIAADMTEAGGLETVAMARDLGADAAFISVDVSRAAQVDQMEALARERFGGLDAAVNAAGIPGRMSSTLDVDEADLDHIYAVNVRGIWLSMRAELRLMIERGGGSIVNISSGGGLLGAPGLPGYSASKHAVVGLTKTAALEYASANIRVNAVCPGGVRTPMMEIAIQDPKRAARIMRGPMGRLAEPQEIADAAAWLCSDRATFVTGVPLPVDGGIMAN